MRVITLNVNGIRSAAKKGLFSWLAAQRADVVCLQEVKAQEHDLDAGLHVPKGYTPFYALAEKKGYSGVATFSREPAAVTRGLGETRFDRVVVITAPSKLREARRGGEKDPLEDWGGGGEKFPPPVSAGRALLGVVVVWPFSTPFGTKGRPG